MISWEEAKTLLKRKPPKLEVETIRCQDALGRILGEVLKAPVAHPPFSRSTMDGYAFVKSENGSAVKLIGEVRAGTFFTKKIKRGECVSITTGGPLPSGAEKVVPLEDIQLSDDGKNTWVHLSKTWEDADQNIFVTKEGADYKKNAQLLEHGRKIGVAELAVLAACGKNKVAVFKKLKVAVLSTGDELVEPGKSLSLAKIWDSNRPQLLSLLNQMGMETLDLGLIGDDEKKLTQKIKQAMIRCDGLILSGGMSAGDRDFSIPVLKKLGAKIIFDRIALKPGKPSVYAIFKNKTKEKFIFGLPGNPISAYVVFEVLVRDYLKSRQGELGDNKKIFARLEQDMPQHRGPRIFFRPIRVDDGGVAHLPRYHGSSHLHAFTQANALYCQKPNEKSPRAGDFILLEKLL